ncbi:MAG TPA: hypothetical protein VMG30_02410 [Acidobacteriota bacterium]|nr:hypothetical protein [Acidobacteriota bacterium]
MRPCLMLIACLFASPLFSQDSAQGSAAPAQSPYVDREEREFNFFPGGRVEIFTGVSGSIKIMGWKKGSVRVEAEKIVYYEDTEKAKAFLQKSPVRVRHTETITTIRVEGIPQSPAMLEVNLTVYIPGERTDINAKMDRGEFSVSSINGWVEVTIGEGSLEAKSMSGYFSGRLRKGDIFVETSGTRWAGYGLDALTQQGSVNLVLPTEYSAALQLETRDGKISVDYPPRIEEGEEIPPQIAINKKSQSLKASVGSGGMPIRLVTYSGDIKLSKKE